MNMLTKLETSMSAKQIMNESIFDRKGECITNNSEIENNFTSLTQ